MTLFKSRK